jgi:tetratricopeptide (TPR) repeat protein
VRQTQFAEQAVRKEPNNVGARLALAASYQSEEKTDQAIKQYDEILKADGSSRAALLGRGGALMTKGDLNAAAASYRKITGKAAKGEFAGADPQLQEARYFLGSIALKQGKTTEAVTELEAALKITRSDSDALYLLGVARLKQNKPKLAVDALTQALQFVPTGWCQPYSQLVKANRQLGNAPKATYAGAMVDFCHKKPADAKRKLKTLVAGPVAVDAMLGLGLIAETASSNAEAISWYQKVVAVDAKNVGALSALSRLGAKPSAASASPSLGAK